MDDVEKRNKLINISSAELKSILENQVNAIQIFDREGTTVFINAAQAKILGIEDRTEPIGTFNVLTDPFSKASGSADFYQKIYRSGVANSRRLELDFDGIPHQWNTRNGKIILSEYAYPVIDSQKQLSYVVAVLSDITEEVHNLELLDFSEKRFRSIFENAVAGTAFTDIEGKIILINGSFEHIVGHKETELKNKYLSEITHVEDKEKERELIRCAIESRSDNCRLEKRYIRKDGSSVWVDVSIAIIRGNDDNPVNFIFIVKDIDKKTQADRDLSKALEINQMIMDTSPVGIVAVDQVGQIYFANKKAEKTLGLHKNKITSRTYNAPEWKITDFNGNAFPEDQLPFIRVKKEKKQIDSIQHAIAWPDGTQIFLSINAKPQLGENSEFLGMIASMEDITDKVEADNKIKETNAFLNGLVTNAAEGLCVCHNCEEFPFVNFTLWNSQMTSITGYTMAEINKLGWYQTLYKDPEIREKAMNRMANMRQGDNITGEEWLINRKDNQEIVMSIATSIIATKGEEVHVMALIDDVTEKRKAKVQLEQLNNDLNKLNESKDKFLAILAHDLRGPLSASLSISNLILDEYEENEKEKTKLLIGHFKKSVERSYNLLNELLEWSQMQSNRIEFNPQQIPLLPLINSTIETLEAMILAKKQKVKVLSADDLQVYAEKNMLHTLIRNLINNAIKYSFPESEILIKIEQDVKETAVSVIDSGVGIEVERVDKLFRIEENVSTYGTQNEKGTGLGLLLCKEIVDYHKGKIWVKNRKEGGTIFSFSIPCKL